MADQHKFIYGAMPGAIKYHHVVFCEYCGQIAFHGNSGDETRQRYQDEAKKPCPRSSLAEFTPINIKGT